MAILHSFNSKVTVLTHLDIFAIAIPRFDDCVFLAAIVAVRPESIIVYVPRSPSVPGLCLQLLGYQTYTGKSRKILHSPDMVITGRINIGYKDLNPCYDEVL